MPACSKKRRLFLAGGVVLLMLVALLLLEKRGLAPSWFHLGEISQQAWARVRGTGRPSDPGKSKKAARAAADRKFEEILAKHPELAVTWKDVPDDENGFLQWLDFIDRCKANGALDLPEDITTMLQSPETWDSKRMAEWLSQHQELIEEITRLGLLPDQSAKGIDLERLSWPNPGLVVKANRLLMASAKLAMEQRDHATALRYLNASLGNADHFDGIEIPSRLDATVSALLRGSSKRFAIEALSETILYSDELKSWQQIIHDGGNDPQKLSSIFLGEWHQTTRNLLAEPDSSATNPIDQDRLVEILINDQRAWQKEIGASDLKSLATCDVPLNWPENISKDGEEMLVGFSKGSNAWVHAWTRGRIEALQAQAAFAVALGEEMPIEPISGKPFVFDPASNTVIMPVDPPPNGFELKPVNVPVVTP